MCVQTFCNFFFLAIVSWSMMTSRYFIACYIVSFLVMGCGSVEDNVCYNYTKVVGPSRDQWEPRRKLVEKFRRQLLIFLFFPRLFKAGPSEAHPSLATSGARRITILFTAAWYHLAHKKRATLWTSSCFAPFAYTVFVSLQNLNVLYV